jgi:hypothetical protein
MTTSARTVRVLTAAVALVASLAQVSSVSGQAGPPSGPPGAERYRLTLKALRAVIPAVQGPAQSRCEKPAAKRDPFAMTLAEMTATLDRCAPVRAELAKAGVSSKEAASVLGAFLYAGRRITEEESAIALGQSAAPLPPGALKDNVALLRQHDAELRRLTRPSGQGSGR